MIANLTKVFDNNNVFSKGFPHDKKEKIIHSMQTDLDKIFTKICNDDLDSSTFMLNERQLRNELSGILDNETIEKIIESLRNIVNIFKS